MKKYKMNAQEREMYDNLNSKDEKKMFSCMTHNQRKKYSKMTGSKAKTFMYTCMNENREYTGKDLKEDILAFTGVKGDLSEDVDESHLQEKQHFCKYCGEGFITEEEVDKHQRTCATTL